MGIASGVFVIDIESVCAGKDGLVYGGRWIDAWVLIRRRDSSFGRQAVLVTSSQPSISSPRNAVLYDWLAYRHDYCSAFTFSRNRASTTAGVSSVPYHTLPLQLA